MSNPRDDLMGAMATATCLRIAIAGVPKAGKSTRAYNMGQSLGLEPRPTDVLAPLEWSAASLEVSLWMTEPGPWLIEGCTVPRALRKWLAKHQDPNSSHVKERRPCDVLIWMPTAREILSVGQRRMAAGCETVFNEVRPRLEKLGVVIVEWK